jgi:FixJ family two-component response regulator
MKPAGAVFIIDDSDGVRKALSVVLRQAGYEVRAFASAQAFLLEFDPDWRGCILVDVRMPDMDGLAFQQHLIQQHVTMPVIFMTGYGEVPNAVQAIKRGAVDFLEKPVPPAALLAKVEEALEQDNTHHRQAAGSDRRGRVAQLTAREREVVMLVTQGNSNKEIGRDLGISYRTVEKHRASAMEKLGAESVADLCRAGLQILND